MAQQAHERYNRRRGELYRDSSGTCRAVKLISALVMIAALDYRFALLMLPCGFVILILDEATSALDETTEKKILENLNGLSDKTVIAVTHRPAALGICDRILEFTESGIVEK